MVASRTCSHEFPDGDESVQGGMECGSSAQAMAPAMLHKIITTSDLEKRYHGGDGISLVANGVMLKVERFGFVMVKYWGDLRTMIDLRMVHNGNQASSFSDEKALRIMH